MNGLHSSGRVRERVQEQQEQQEQQGQQEQQELNEGKDEQLLSFSMWAQPPVAGASFLLSTAAMWSPSTPQHSTSAC